MKKYITTVIVAILLTILILGLANIFNQKNIEETYKKLTNTFFVVGVLFFGSGILVLSSNEGTFGMLTYGISLLTIKFKSKKEPKYKNYREYCHYRNNESKISYGHLLTVGLVWISIALLFLLAYSNVTSNA